MSRKKIKELIEKYPRHYSVMISKNQELLDFLKNNTLAVGTTHIPTMIHCLIHNESNICGNGKPKKITRLADGLVNCGPASTCQCTKDSISENVSITKQKYTAEDHGRINTLREASMIKKYGVSHNLKRGSVKEKLKSPKTTSTVNSLLTDREWINNQYNVLGKSASEISNELDIYYGTVLDHVRKHGYPVNYRYSRSIVEKEIEEYISSLGISVEVSDRKLLNGLELDIVVPSKRVAIEVNGLYWHSFNPTSGLTENKRRHIDKTVKCNDIGWRLIHITDYEWHNQNSIIKSIIRSSLGLNTSIFGRKTTVTNLTTSMSSDFFKTSHLSKSNGGSLKLGLIENDVIVSAIIIGKSRFHKNTHELIRYATLPGYTVVGGLSKMMHYVRQNYAVSVYSYCDLSKFNGMGYDKSGFEWKYNTEPGYFWTNGSNKLSRYQTQKHKLHLLLPEFDSALSESSNMFKSGYRRYWDCGNAVYHWT